jgi:hypothetical protein
MTTDWDHDYSWDMTQEPHEESLVGDRRMDVCPLCHMRPCLQDCYNVGMAHYSSMEADYNARDDPQEEPEERERRDLE